MAEENPLAKVKSIKELIDKLQEKEDEIYKRLEQRIRDVRKVVDGAKLDKRYDEIFKETDEKYTFKNFGAGLLPELGSPECRLCSKEKQFRSGELDLTNTNNTVVIMNTPPKKPPSMYCVPPEEFMEDSEENPRGLPAYLEELKNANPEDVNVILPEYIKPVHPDDFDMDYWNFPNDLCTKHFDKEYNRKACFRIISEKIREAREDECSERSPTERKRIAVKPRSTKPLPSKGLEAEKENSPSSIEDEMLRIKELEISQGARRKYWARPALVSPENKENGKGRGLVENKRRSSPLKEINIETENVPSSSNVETKRRQTENDGLVEPISRDMGVSSQKSRRFSMD